MGRKKTRLRVENNWERLTYFVRDVKLDETRPGTVLVQWPNGKEERVHYTARQEQASYVEQGPGLCRITRWRLYAMLDVNGHTVETPLEELTVLEA